MENEQIKKLGISLDELKKMQKKVDETYFNLCDLGLYGDAYTRLQNISGFLDNLLNNEHLDEDELDDVYFFYVNNFKS